MPLTVFYGLMTLVPLVAGLALVALGLARRATPAFGVTLAAIGVLLPVVALAWLATEVSAGFPLEIALWGGATTWLAIYARADALATYTGIGIAAIVTPLLIWTAWRAAPPDAQPVPADEARAAAEDDDKDADTDNAGEAEDDAGEAEDDAEDADSQPSSAALEAPRMMRRWQWAGVALALALESALLSLVFAENILWLTLCWLIVIGLSWALGELGSDTKTLDWKGLALMAIPAIIWVVPTLMIAVPHHAARLIDLTGSESYPLGHSLVMILGIALAAGAWPALGWVRKRASITAPAGLGAAILAVIPAALLVGARTFSLAQSVATRWPATSLGLPPITVGALLVLLGAVTTLFAGLLALGRRDGRGLLASCALAFSGWGLIGLGVGAPLAALGVTLLLTSSILGLGAMLAALVASGAITADIEPDSAGPRIFGERPSGPLVFAWIVGAASAVGLPLFAGFMPQQLITAAALPGARVVIPLTGLAWGGSALLLLGLLRATAPAFTRAATEDAAISAPMEAEEVDEDDTTRADESEESEDVEAEATEKEKAADAPELPELQVVDLPAVALGVLTLIAGVAPSALMMAGAIPATAAFLQQGALDGQTQAQLAGYGVIGGQWYATPAALALIVVTLTLALIRWRAPRLAPATPLYLSGQLDVTPEEEDGEAVFAEELASLAEPAAAWEELRSTMTAGWLTPGGGWLGGMSDDLGGASAALDESADDDESETDESDEFDENEFDENEFDENDESEPDGESDDEPDESQEAEEADDEPEADEQEAADAPVDGITDEPAPASETDTPVEATVDNAADARAADGQSVQSAEDSDNADADNADADNADADNTDADNADADNTDEADQAAADQAPGANGQVSQPGRRKARRGRGARGKR